MQLSFNDIPFSTDQITLLQYAEFRHHEIDYLKALKETEDSVDHSDIGLAQDKLVKALSCVTNLSEEQLYEFPLFVDKKDWELVDNYIIQIGDHLSLIRLYAHIITLIKSRKPKSKKKKFNFQFTHNGVKYIWDKGLYASSIIDDPQLPSGIAILVSDIRSLYQDKMKDQFDVNNANYDFAMGKRELAYLCRRKGEQVPINIRERDIWLEQRQKEFETVPLSVLLDLRFFLTNTFNVSSLIGDIKSTSKDPPIFTMSTPKQVM